MQLICHMKSYSGPAAYGIVAHRGDVVDVPEPEATRLLQDYPEGWAVYEPTAPPGVREADEEADEEAAADTPASYGTTVLEDYETKPMTPRRGRR